MQSAPQELEHFIPPPDRHGFPQEPEQQQSEQSSSIGQPALMTEKPRQASAKGRSRWRSLRWKNEIFSWLASLCFFIAIVVVLAVLNGRPLPDLQFGLSPNAIIGLLSTFAQFLLMVSVSSAIGQIKWLHALRNMPVDDFRVIDEASRGPWGSLLLLLNRKGGFVAGFGAIITILALGISAFFQQALIYVTIYPDSGYASMPVARYMNGTGFAPFGGGKGILGVDNELLAAPYDALYAPAHTQYLAKPYCSTGNCTWESYHTLSICNTCANLTSKLNMTKQVMVPFNRSDLVYDTDYYLLSNGFGLTGIQPSGWINENDHRVSYAISVQNAMLNVTTSTSIQRTEDSHLVHNASVAFTNNGSRLLSVFAVGPSPKSMPRQPDANFSSVPMTGGYFAPPVAYECVLQFCVREMRGEVTNGTVSETVVSTWTNQTQVSSLSSLFLRPPNSNDTFFVDYEAVGGTGLWLSDFLTGTSSTLYNYKGSYWVLDTEDFSGVLIQPLFQQMNESTSGFPDLMDNLANSLSLNLRTISYQPAGATGKAFSSTSQAVVTWEWLILPLLELVGSLIFLVVVMVETRKNGLAPWTNSVLAPLFHGFDTGFPARHAGESTGAMEDDARGLLMEFRHEDGGHLAIIEH